MRTSRTFLSVLACLFLCWLVLPAQGQIAFPFTPDQYVVPAGAVPSATITNTAEAEIPAGSGVPLQVMTWDGPNPAFGWDYAGLVGAAPIAGSGLGTLQHPDIVTDPSANPGDERVLIIYHINFSEVYFEVHSWNGSTFVLTVGPTLISAAASSVSHPNVDIYHDGRAVMTWSENGVVYGRGYILPALSLSPNTFNASACYIGTCDRSDVAGFKPLGSPGNRTNFIFVNNNGTTDSLIVQRASWGQIWSGAAANCGTNWTHLLDVVNLANEQFGIPRIACPNRLFSGLYVREDASAVCVKYDNTFNTYTVNNYTHHAATWGANVWNPNSINTIPNDISPCANKYPAISYVGEFIISTWTYEDCFGYINGDLDAIARQMNFDGSLVYNDYSLVNQNFVGDQFYSAIDGKFSVTQDGFYTWYDQPMQTVGYKFSLFSNLNLRLATEQDVAEDEVAETTEFTAYPNPMVDNATFRFSLAEGEVGEQLEIYNLAGQVVDRVSLVDAAEGVNLVDWQTAEVPAGVYIVKLISNQRTESLRMTKQ